MVSAEQKEKQVTNNQTYQKVYKMSRKVSFTRKQFLALRWEEKITVAENPNTLPATQQLFFTEDYESRTNVLCVLATVIKNTDPATQLLFFTSRYEWKGRVLWHLAGNRNITPEVQPLFFTEEYERKGEALSNLANNPSLVQETQRLFFTYKYKGRTLLHHYWALTVLAQNRKLHPDTQLLFLKQNYNGKYEALKFLVRNVNVDTTMLMFSDKNWLKFILECGNVKGLLKLVPTRIKKLPEYKTTRILSQL